MWNVSLNIGFAYIMMNRPEEQIGDGQKESEEEMKPKWSIQDRIFAMESKIEEDRLSGSLTSSGFATPRLTKLR